MIEIVACSSAFIVGLLPRAFDEVVGSIQNLHSFCI
jgi:hypothetical protein